MSDDLLRRETWDPALAEPEPMAGGGAAHGKRSVASAIADRGAAAALQLQLAVRPVGQAMLQAERWRGSPGAHGAKPATGATVQIAASKKVAFRAAKELKAAV